MIEEEGIVSEIVDGMAKVAITKKSACEKCAASGVCHPDEQDLMEAANPLGAKKGQKVKVVIAPQLYLKASIILYGIPMTVFIAAAIGAKNLAIRLGSEANSDLWAFLAGAGALIVSFLFIRAYNNRVEKTQKYKPVIVEILS
jgi:sigma-E factor negative regulatory protein RseC